MRYYANGITWELIEESDGWWSIYEIHPVTQQRIPKLQAKDLAHAKSYCYLTETVNIPMQAI